MGYTFSDASQKTIGAGPSINGLRELKTILQQNQPENFPALSHLLVHGHTTKLTQLKIECRTLSQRTNNADVKSSLANIIKLADKADEMLILEA